MEGLSISPSALAVVAVLLGLIIGSFLNVVIHRLPLLMEREWRRQCAELEGKPPPSFPHLSLAWPASHCPHCAHRLSVWENIPLLSFFLLRGRCRNCQATIDWRYPLVEGATGILFALAAWRFGPSWALLAAWLFIAYCLALTFIDFETQLLPDVLTLSLLWVGLLLNLKGLYAPLDQAVLGAIAGYLALWSIYWLFKLLMGKEGMGYGDFKLFAALGAWFGWPALPMAILLASLVGAAVGLFLILTRRQARDKPIPFGPYLAGAGLLMLFTRDSLLTLWLG
ncbi:MAG: A24 family peptidase [Rhodocyclaceae bacterium]|nr:A24 family peptidase [Rhodocyclaceae bacterium]